MNFILKVYAYLAFTSRAKLQKCVVHKNSYEKCQVTVNLFHLVAQLFHDFHVKRLEPVTVGVDEVEAAVNTIIHDVLSVETTLVPKIPKNKSKSNKMKWVQNRLYKAVNDKKLCRSIKSPFELIVDVSNDLLEAVGVVDGIAEAGSVNDGQSELDTAFLNLHSRCIQLNGLLLL